MTVLVLAFLVVVWGAVLVPAYLRKRVERRSGDSIGDFHRQLGVLERTGPTLVNPAHRLFTPREASRGNLPPVAAPPASLGETVSRRVSVGGISVATGAHNHGLRRRRRHTLFTALGATSTFLVLGSIPQLHLLWVFAGLCALATAGYVLLLVQFAKLEAEREVKVVYLPSVASEPTVTLKRSAAN